MPPLVCVTSDIRNYLVEMRVGTGIHTEVGIQYIFWLGLAGSS